MGKVWKVVLNNLLNIEKEKLGITLELSNQRLNILYIWICKMKILSIILHNDNL